MQPPTTNLPDNVKSRLSRVYVDNREFHDPDINQLIKYDRLVLEVLIKGEAFPIEFKP